MPTAAKGVISVLIAFHLLALFLNNLAWSPLVAALYPYYSPYVKATGQVQDWGMYKDPFHFDERITIEAIHGNGLRELPTRKIEEESPRMLYFLEGLFTANRDREAKAFLSWLMDRIPAERRPKALALRRETRPTPAPGTAGPDWREKSYTLSKEIVFPTRSVHP